MFDPIVFDNLKVAFENQLYDLDTLDRTIDIIGRKDLLDMAVMSRQFILSFRLAGEEGVTADVVLSASLKDIAAEILEHQGESPACGLTLRFYMKVTDVEVQCAAIERSMLTIWQQERKPVQTLSRIFGSGDSYFNNIIELPFDRKINEEQMEDIPELIQHMLETLAALHEI
ncbi:hypothetical protein I6N90_10630 [Paenibacillus sp. GSMTC-2017]|uniref:hypothetical protein n=1 Tax=Paenibacillus sp. GSMTC-2017 TaxID=2794350 RepID=UPI0018D6218D|nr:hypothetical protein [Paenibacillus sp. GSMTC-2017]MBH5318264.1 hypothetical protein [Paenibacillus sp. GSMTC-2017]